MVWLVQNCRSVKCLQFLKPPELRRGALPPWAPCQGSVYDPLRTLSGPQTPRLLTPPLTTNPGSAPRTSSSCQTIFYDGFLLIWCNFKFEGVLFRSDSRHNDRVDGLQGRIKVLPLRQVGQYIPNYSVV
jgi:hypothetical protein